MEFLKLNKLTRAKFHDRPLNARHLWAAAEFWRGAFPISEYLTTGSYQLSAEIWGFPRHEAADNPSELIALHDEHVRRMVERGHHIVKSDADQYPALVIAGHEEAREFYRHNPIYSWGDALHEAFGVVRKQRD